MPHLGPDAVITRNPKAGPPCKPPTETGNLTRPVSKPSHGKERWLAGDKLKPFAQTLRTSVTIVRIAGPGQLAARIQVGTLARLAPTVARSFEPDR